MVPDLKVTKKMASEEILLGAAETSGPAGPARTCARVAPETKLPRKILQTDMYYIQNIAPSTRRIKKILHTLPKLLRVVQTLNK